MRGIWLCALALTVLAVVTAPLAVSRYTAQGAGTARARIAAFMPEFVQVAGHFGAGGYAIRCTATGWSGQLFPKFYVRNASEVAVNVKLEPYYVPEPCAVGDVKNGHQVGKYHGTGARALVPAAGFSGAGATGGTLIQLRNDTRYYATAGAIDTQPNRVTLTPTGTVQPTTGYGTLLPLEPNAGGILLATFFESYQTAAPGQPASHGNANTGTSRNMEMLWRTYRINYDLVVTQVD